MIIIFVRFAFDTTADTFADSVLGAGVDASSGIVFCNQCNDVIYDYTLTKLFMETRILAEEKYSGLKVNSSKVSTKEPFKHWVPIEKDTAALAGAAAIPCQARRGLLNLGQTCFLNVVLQSFLHNPLLRNYYLADKHNPKSCKHETCTSCEMDKLFTEIYSGDTTPYGPISFLATSWQTSPDLAGYAQQDAHEFFMSALNAIHNTSRGSTNRFEHKTSDKSSTRKIDAPIRIPASICMAPYTTFALEDPEKTAQGIFPGPSGMFDYDLFAVINHEGNMDNGHYTNFARYQNEWCRFDDDKVTPSTLAACLNSPAYMCFYVKRYLDYKVDMRPTYVIARETEALREKEKERETEKECRGVSGKYLDQLKTYEDVKSDVRVVTIFA
ncbi:hypothetical protein H0H93_010764 [Arthromyces matolae]|nr:hypothetical protein H0H93_010764 [Arthromyces matolae]